jgi:hypothetical protein
MNIDKIKVGKTYKVIKTPPGLACSNGYGTYQSDSERNIKIISKDPNSNKVYSGECYYFPYELKSLEPDTKEEILESIKEVQNEIETKNSEISNLRSKLKFMEENGLEEFDEDQFKVFRTLELIDSKDLSKMEMVKEIAKLIKNN